MVRKWSDGLKTIPKLTLVLGGARSGKTGFAETLAKASGPKRTYLATAEAMDDEMAMRIAIHRRERGEGWHTIEEPLDLMGALKGLDQVVLIDCLTLWLSNLMHADLPINEATRGLLRALEACSHDVILVSNEVGMGLVPDTALGRQFRDAQGRLNQIIAARAARVVFVAAGLPLVMKGSLPEGIE